MWEKSAFEEQEYSVQNIDKDLFQTGVKLLYVRKALYEDVKVEIE